MAKRKNNSSQLSYLYLGILGLITGVGLEALSGKVALFTLPEMTLYLLLATLYILAGTFLTAFVASTGIEKEQKYILYLVILGLLFVRVILFIGNIA